MTPDETRTMAARLYNDAWALLRSADRSSDDDLMMLHKAHASRLLWEDIGTAREHSIGEWQVARVYSTLNLGEAALLHAQASLRHAERLGDPVFLCCAHEAVARALRTSGKDFQAHLAQARVYADQVKDPEDREILDRDLNDYIDKAA